MLRVPHANDVVPCGTNEKILKTQFSGFFGGDTRIRTGGRGVADLCLTAWLCRRIYLCHIIIAEVFSFVKPFFSFFGKCIFEVLF